MAASDNIVAFPDQWGPSGDSPIADRAAMLSRLAEQSDEVLDEAWPRLAELPGYGRLTPAQARVVRTAMRAAFGAILEAARADRGLTLDEQAVFEAIGVERARMGVDRGDATEAFDLGFDACYQQLIELGAGAGEPESGQVLGRLAARLRRLGQAAREAVVRGHDAHTGHEVPQVSGHRTAYVETVLAGDADEQTLAARAAAAGVSDGPWTLLVAVATDRGAATAGEAGLVSVGNALAEAAGGGLAASCRDEPWPHVPVIAPGVEVGDIADACRPIATDRGLVVVAAAGSSGAPVGGVYQRVRPHVRALIDLAPSGQVTGLEQLRAYEPLASCPPTVARSIVAETLDGLLGDPRGRSAMWLETLEAMVEAACDVSVAAGRLHVTARTVYFRLDSIREASGIDLDEPGVMFRVGLAVYLYRLHQAGLPPSDDPSWCRNEG